MGHRQQVGKPSRYVTSHINRHTAWCISPCSWSPLQCKLVSGWELRTQRLTLTYGS